MALSNAEKQKRWRDKRNALVREAMKLRERHGGGAQHGAPLRNELAAGGLAGDREIAALRQELAQAKARIRELTLERAAQAQASRDEMRRRPAKPKAEKPPLPPDEERDRRIKALTTENRNLRGKVRHLEQHFEDGIAHAGGMNFATQSAIAKCLHPDHTPSEEQRAEACRLFTSWKADKDKAQRKAR
jgi:hypothetical protein